MCKLKNIHKILILILVSCKKQTKKEIELLKSDFNFKKDYADFKHKMTELDTLKIWVNHSVCTYEGYERIEITKKSDSIKIRTEYKEETFEQNPEWKVIYEKLISANDTIWDFGKFMKRNNKRLTSDIKEYGMIQIKSGNDEIQFFTNGLLDLNRFTSDYFETMRKLHHENKQNIYGVYESDIKETALGTK